MSTRQQCARSLGRGHFIGRQVRVVATAGFLVTEQVDDPDLPVSRHSHEDAHFLFVMGAPYATSACGSDEGTCLPELSSTILPGPPMLIVFAPPAARS